MKNWIHVMIMIRFFESVDVICDGSVYFHFTHMHKMRVGCKVGRMHFRRKRRLLSWNRFSEMLNLQLTPNGGCTHYFETLFVYSFYCIWLWSAFFFLFLFCYLSIEVLLPLTIRYWYWTFFIIIESDQDHKKYPQW